MRKLSFWQAGQLMQQSFELRFLKRADVMILIGVLMAGDCLIEAVRQTGSSAGGLIDGALRHPTLHVLSSLDMIAMWFLTLTVTRAWLTPWRGIALWRLDRGGLQSLGVNAVIQAFPAGLTLLAASGANDYLSGSAAFTTKAAGISLLCALCLFWIWLAVRCFAMSYLAWESGNAGFQIRRSYEAMKGHVWSYIFWGGVLAIPFALVIVLLQKTATFTAPGSYLMWGSLLVANLIAAANHVVFRSFDLRFFQALQLDQPVKSETGNLFGSY
ncbi:hypothetical protein HW511_12310 [Asaia siamensis]|uniref:Uncharacterized protein n=1 Tax=Asaia siamensis TaxID=110479 RepID=A0ABQ1MBS0_9PROT|nr:hypothetical protein [Asaia siamensis]GBR03528.1 hypothetical protein AA0323_0334 [Asaia siamensis NRIC 0323]GGC38081.1 hypothetical protein GCM10007207_24560 [Asaia siamensis]